MPSRYKERYKVMWVIKTIFRFRFNLDFIWRISVFGNWYAKIYIREAAAATEHMKLSLQQHQAINGRERYFQSFYVVLVFLCSYTKQIIQMHA